MAGSYAWRPGSHIKIDAQKAGEELDQVRVRANGRLTPEGVVSHAKNRVSVLHDHFDWNDKSAAHSYRLGQASHLIRCITVEMPAGGEAVKPVRAFVSVVREEDRSYTTTAHAMSDAELRRQVLATALNELEAWRNRYAELVELADVFAVIDQARSA